MPGLSTYSFLALAAAAALATAQSLPSFSSLSSQCVDSAGFTTCWNNATNTAQSCFGDVGSCKGTGSCTDENDCSSTDKTCTSNCVCDAYANWINCALSHCWNEIYSCEYQNLAIEANTNCPGAGVGPLSTDTSDNYIPSVPAPDAAPGGCSCDISYVYYRHGTAHPAGAVCAARVANGTLGVAGATADECTCCGASEAVSAFYNTCPNTSPAAVPQWDATIGADLATLRSAACVAALDGFDCRKLGFAKPGITGGNFYNASSLPANGTATISDVAGNSITSPVGGPTLVWRLGDKFDNMTAVAASVTGSGSGSSPSGTASGSASASATHSAAVATVAGGGDVRLVAWMVGMVALGMAFL